MFPAQCTFNVCIYGVRESEREREREREREYTKGKRVCNMAPNMNTQIKRTRVI